MQVELLKRIADFDFENYNHCGSAPQGTISRALSSLLATDPSSRQRGFEVLFNSVSVQGQLFDATYFVVPFLIEMICTPAGAEEFGVYDLLNEIVRGSGSSDFTADPSRAAGMTLRQACRLQVLERKDMIFKCVSDCTRPSWARIEAAWIFEPLHESYDEWAPELRKILAAESDANLARELRDILEGGKEPELSEVPVPQPKK